jgi:ubiquinone/menaquinone biosynthesis C-methylase UbiE
MMGVTDRLYGIYDAVAERPQVARVFGRFMWGTDTRLFYGAHAEVAGVPEGAKILDVPCGGGPAFRYLRPGRSGRYLAVDLEDRMLDRARAEANRRGLDGIEFVQASVEAMPFDDATADLCVTSAGLHCFPDPAAALAEMARCLRPGGRLVGTTVVNRAGARHDALIAFYRRMGVFGPGGTVDDYGRWAANAGLEQVRIERSGAIVGIDAVRAG